MRGAGDLHVGGHRRLRARPRFCCLAIRRAAGLHRELERLVEVLGLETRACRSKQGLRLHGAPARIPGRRDPFLGERDRELRLHRILRLFLLEDLFRRRFIRRGVPDLLQAGEVSELVVSGLRGLQDPLRLLGEFDRDAVVAPPVRRLRFRDRVVRLAARDSRVPEGRSDRLAREELVVGAVREVHLRQPTLHDRAEVSQLKERHNGEDDHDDDGDDEGRAHRVFGHRRVPTAARRLNDLPSLFLRDSKVTRRGTPRPMEEERERPRRASSSTGRR